MSADRKAALRAQLRKKRRAIPAQTHATASAAICQRLLAQAPLDTAQRIAAYLSNDGEPDLGALISHLWQRGAQVLLPVLDGDRLRFREYTADMSLVRNRYRIDEPPPAAAEVDVDDLDVVLMPLVGFDVAGNRLGMGGGYYDRSLQNIKSNAAARPLLIGTAFDCQCVAEVVVEQTDVGLDAVVTETRSYQFS